MAQQQREENSVLFSLKELRRLEDDRQRQEDDDRRAKAESERQARADEERRIREEQERKVREEQDRVRRIEEERVARDREDHMRLQEAERRARVEGEVRLQEQRMRLEANVQAPHKSPIKLIVGVVGVVVVLAGIVAFKLYSDAEKARAEQAVAIRASQEAAERSAKERQRLEAQLAEQQRLYNAQLKQMEGEMLAARTKAERDTIQSRIDNLKKNKRPAAGHTATPPPSGSPGIRVRDISDDPLGNLPK
jgi:hypothetical protein